MCNGTHPKQQPVHLRAGNITRREGGGGLKENSVEMLFGFSLSLSIERKLYTIIVREGNNK